MARAREIETREWWLWAFAVTVTLALAAGIVALSFPGYHLGSDSLFSSDLKERVRGLAALVLLFDIYTVYQHFELHRVRRRLAQSNELFELITENAADMIALVDNQGHRLYNSPAYEKVLGYSPDELMLQPATEQIHPADREHVWQAAEKARLTGEGQRLEYRMRHKDGSWRVFESTASAVPNKDGQIEKLVIVNRDITERRRVEALLAHNALHDGLTGLPNRALFLDRVQQALTRARRHSDFRFAVLFIDIDNFKVFNDSLGHSAGDDLLIQIGNRLQGCFRETDTVSRPGGSEVSAAEDESVARLGGDEFTVLLEDISEPGDAVRVTQRIQARCRKPFLINDQEVVVSSSVGIALGATAYSQGEHLVRDAELAMYRAKRAGKACCEVFDPDMHASAVRRMKTETDLRNALELEELLVYYQPIISLETGKIVGFEALSRWLRPEGLILPGEFISIANETGLIVPINRKLMLQACRQLAIWQAECRSEPLLTMSMNVAPKQFARSDLASEIQEIIQQTGVPPETVQLEIMETIAMDDADRAADVLTELKKVGVLLTIDDFGTGYSSLSRLQKLPVDSLKVDRTFVSRMVDHSDSAAIVKLIITMAHTVNLRVVAEGTETEEQVNALKRLRCEMAQGYFFSRPVPATAITKLLSNQLLTAAASAHHR